MHNQFIKVVEMILNKDSCSAPKFSSLASLSINFLSFFDYIGYLLTTWPRLKLSWVLLRTDKIQNIGHRSPPPSSLVSQNSYKMASLLSVGKIHVIFHKIVKGFIF